MDNDDPQKKTKQFLIRVEEDVHDFFIAKAKQRRVPVAQVLRELLYQKMEEEKKGKTDGKL